MQHTIIIKCIEPQNTHTINHFFLRLGRGVLSISGWAVKSCLFLQQLPLTGSSASDPCNRREETFSRHCTAVGLSFLPPFIPASLHSLLSKVIFKRILQELLTENVSSFIFPMIEKVSNNLHKQTNCRQD